MPRGKQRGINYIRVSSSPLPDTNKNTTLALISILFLEVFARIAERANADASVSARNRPRVGFYPLFLGVVARGHGVDSAPTRQFPEDAHKDS